MIFVLKINFEIPFSSRRAFCSSLHFLIFSGSSLTCVTTDGSINYLKFKIYV